MTWSSVNATLLLNASERIVWCVGSQKVNQDFICLLLGERRYELPITLWVPKINDCFIVGKRRNMSPNDAEHQSLRPCYRTRELSDIIRAISLPNATLRGNWLYWAVNVGAPKVNQDLSVCFGEKGERRYELLQR